MCGGGAEGQRLGTLAVLGEQFDSMILKASCNHDSMVLQDFLLSVLVVL